MRSGVYQQGLTWSSGLSSAIIPKFTPLPSMDSHHKETTVISNCCSVGFIWFGPVGREFYGFIYWVSKGYSGA